MTVSPVTRQGAQPFYWPAETLRRLRRAEADSHRRRFLLDLSYYALLILPRSLDWSRGARLLGWLAAGSTDLQRQRPLHRSCPGHQSSTKGKIMMNTKEPEMTMTQAASATGLTQDSIEWTRNYGNHRTHRAPLHYFLCPESRTSETNTSHGPYLTVQNEEEGSAPAA